MLKKIILLINIIMLSYASQTFAFGPGSAQAQIRNNQEVVKQNQQHIQQHRRNHAVHPHYKKHNHPRVQY